MPLLLSTRRALLIPNETNKVASALMRNLESVWLLDKANGTFADLVGGNTLSSTLAPTKVGGAARMTIVDSDYCFPLDSTNFQYGDEDFAFAGWVYLEAKPAAYSIILSVWGSGAASYQLYYDTSADRFAWQARNGGDTAYGTATANTFGAVSAGTWYFIYVYHDATANELGISINDGTVDTGAIAGGVHTVSAGFSFGLRADGALPLNGYIDEWGAWSGSVPSSATITSIYNSGSGKAYTSLTAGEKTDLQNWWSFDEWRGGYADLHGSDNLLTSFQRYGRVGDTDRFLDNAVMLRVGDADYGYIADNASLSTGDVDFAFAGWAKMDTISTNQVIISKHNTSDVEYVLYYADAPTNRFRFAIQKADDSGAVTVSADNWGAAVASIWYFVYIYHDATANVIGISINRGTADTAAVPAGVRDGTAQFRIGSRQIDGLNWSGRLANWHYWKNSLPPSDALDALYNRGLGLSYPFTGKLIDNVGALVSNDGLGRPNNNMPYRWDSLTQWETGGTTYEAVVFWGQTGAHMVVGKRAAGGSWTLYTMDGAGGRPTINVSSPDDNHDVCVMGIDPDGIIHVAYDMHNEALNYRVANAALDSWAGVFGAETSMLGTNETSVSYPTFFNDPAGDLYFMFRDGSAGNGDLYLYKYNTGTSSWAAATGTGAGGKLIEGTAGSVNPYWSLPPRFDADFGSGGYMHLAWTWREVGGQADSRNVAYVKWDGTNWYQADDTAQTVPITDANEEVVDAVGVDSGLLSFVSIDSDSSGYPHIIYTKAGTDGFQQIYHVYHNGAAWQSPVALTSSDVIFTEGAFDFIAGQVGEDTSVPQIAIDRATDTVYVLFTGSSEGTGIFYYRSGPGNYSTWTKHTITTAQVGFWDVIYNRKRWLADTVLQFILTPYVERGHLSPAPIRILEYTP